MRGHNPLKLNKKMEHTRVVQPRLKALAPAKRCKFYQLVGRRQEGEISIQKPVRQKQGEKSIEQSWRRSKGENSINWPCAGPEVKNLLYRSGAAAKVKNLLNSRAPVRR
jgi:hypothetical protein